MDHTTTIKQHPSRFKHLLDLAKKYPPIITAVVHPTSADALKGALDAAAAKLITPVLIGPTTKITATARELNIDLNPYEIIDEPHSHAAAQHAVTLAKQGKVQMLMKGSLHTDELMHEVLEYQGGLRTDKRISHVFILDVPTYHKFLLLSDCAINIDPDLATKRDIVQHAINLAHAIGIEHPKVAILSATETVNSNIPSTIDAAALCKMADRGQITGAILDGPLAFDNAISKTAADEKNIVSNIAGDADILIAPNLEAGNILAKQLEYLAGAQTSGIALGAKVPIVLTSRSDSALARVLSCALGVLYLHRK